MAKASKWDVIPHVGAPIELKAEVRTVKRKKRVYVPAPTQETRPEVLALIEAKAEELRQQEEWSKELRKSSRTRVRGHYHTSGPVCKECGVDYLDIPLSRDPMTAYEIGLFRLV